MSQTVKSLQIVGASFLVGLAAACGGSDQPVPEPETTAAVTEPPATVPMDMEFADDLGVDMLASYGLGEKNLGFVAIE